MRVDRRALLRSLALGFAVSPLAELEAMTLEQPAFELIPSVNRFGWELFRGLGSGNLFLSPTSLAMALGMTELGARSSTRQEMRKVLHLPESDGMVPWHHLVDGLNQEKPGRQIRVANRLFGQKGYAFAQAFLRQVEQVFKAPLEELDFSSAAEPSRVRINRWVSEQTRGLIPDLIPTGAIKNDTRMVLANAIHFKGDWLRPFSKNSTSQAPFETARDKPKLVERMRQKGRFTVRENEYAQVLELPCKGNDRSVHFLLPKVRHGLAEVETRLSPDAWNSLLFADKAPEEVGIGLPRFRIEVAKTMNAPLATLGMPTAFTDRADFSGMNDGKEPLKIDLIFHKALLLVDELGAEAAAATAILMAPTSMPAKPPREFLVDQPFLVAITDKTTQAILFLGRIADPAKI